MRTRLLLLMLLLGLGGFGPRPAAAADNAAPATVTRLIAQLGSTEFAEREKATRDLDALGPAALPSLRQAAAGDDPEVRRRAETLVRRLEARELARKVLTPTRVHLVYKDEPLREALDDLQRKTGTQFLLQDADGRLAGRRVTLDTGDTTAWEAIDQFCRKAGLAEPEDPFDPRRTGGNGPGYRTVPPGFPAQAAQIQAAQMQLQIQMQMQVQMANGGIVTRSSIVGGAPGPVPLVDGKPLALPTHYAGAVRVRALPAEGPLAVPRRSSELAVVLEAAAEPRLPWLGALSVQVNRAVDDAGQHLERAWPPAEAVPAMLPQAGVMRAVRVRTNLPVVALQQQELSVLFKKGEKPSKVLKEMSGTILAQVQTEPEAIMTVDKVLESTGQTVKGSEGGSIKVLQAARADNGMVTFRFQVENPPDVTPAGLRSQHHAPLDSGPIPVANPAGGRTASGGFNGLNLLDDKGNLLPLLPMRTQVQSNGVTVVWDYTFAYRPDAGQGDPAKLVFAGCRTATISIPFTLTDVPLR